MALIQTNEALLQEAIYKDYGKCAFDTFLTEFYVIYDELKTAIEKLPEWGRTRTVDTNPLNAPARSYIIPEPLGVSLVIGPWNYPYQLSLGPAVAAIASGCTVILKPSELTANCSALLATLITGAFDKRYFAVVEGGIPETTALLVSCPRNR